MSTDRALLQIEIKRLRLRLHATHQLTSAMLLLAASFSEPIAYRSFAKGLSSLVSYRRLAILPVTSEPQSFGLAYLQEESREYVSANFLSERIHSPALHLVTQTRKAVLGKPDSEERLAIDDGMRSVIRVPLVVSRDCLGVLTIGHEAENRYDEWDLYLVQTLATLLATVISHLRLRRNVEAISLVDPQTGLFSRRYFQERLVSEINRARRYKRTLGLLLIEIAPTDSAREIDGRVLRNAATAMRRMLRSSDVVVRREGNQFATLLPEADLSQLRPVAEKLRTFLRQTFAGADARICVGGSVLPEGEVEPTRFLVLVLRALAEAHQVSDGIVLAPPPSLAPGAGDG